MRFALLQESAKKCRKRYRREFRNGKRGREDEDGRRGIAVCDVACGENILHYSTIGTVCQVNTDKFFVLCGIGGASV
jgi:hypothetical protein